MFEDNPIAGTSIYLHVQIDVLLKIGAEIESELDSGISDESIDGAMLNKIYGIFWLWILGAFEVTRTLHASTFLIESKRKEVKSFKDYLIRIRAPMAKHKLAGRSEPVKTELAISGVNSTERDFYFVIGGENFCVRRIIENFRNLISSIKPSDVL